VVVDNVYRNGSVGGIQVIIVYPMNTLANSQFGAAEGYRQLHLLQELR